MTLKNIDLNTIVQKIESAPTEDKAKAIVDAISEVAEQHYAETITQYQKDAEELEATKQSVSKFGLRNLTNEEKSFMSKVAKQTFTGSSVDLIPQTTIDYIFEDIKKAHPLFDYITFAPAGINKWMLSDRNGRSIWGPLTGAITEEIEASINVINLDVHKLSSFLYVPKAIVNLGEVWIDKFVRECLEEANSEGLEYGIIAGDGKTSPIGMLKDISGAVVDGVYPDKTPVAITNLGPDSFGSAVLGTLNRNGTRAVDQVVIIANQLEIDSKIYKATHARGFGGYAKAELYKNFVFVASSQVPANKAIAYIPKRYVAGISSMGVDASREYKFLEDLITYAVVAYGNGRLIANDDAVVLDITNLEALVPLVETLPVV